MKSEASLIRRAMSITSDENLSTSAPDTKSRGNLIIDLATVFQDFDEGHKGWLSMQDVQAVTLALCGFWPDPFTLMQFFTPQQCVTDSPCKSEETEHKKLIERNKVDYMHSKSTSNFHIQAQSQVPHEWLLGEGEYFRVKTPEMLQPWLLEAVKQAEIERYGPRQQVSQQCLPSKTCRLYPPPLCGVVGQVDSKKTTIAAVTPASNLGCSTQSFAEGKRQDKIRQQGHFCPSRRAGTWTWEEIFSALDVTKDAFLDCKDLITVFQALSKRGTSNTTAHISNRETSRKKEFSLGATVEELCGCLIELGGRTNLQNVSSNRIRMEKKVGISRRQFLAFMKSSSAKTVD